MSQVDTVILDEEHIHPEPSPVLGSLEHRVAERRRKLEAETTHKFDVPGYEGVFKVELQLVGGKRQHQIIKKNEAVRGYQNDLRNAADVLLAATVGFYAVIDDEHDQLAEGCTWKRLAKAAHPHLDDAVLESQGGNRIALITLLGDDGVFLLAGLWGQWRATRGEDVEAKLEDFS